MAARELTIASFNTHYGLLPMSNNCGPYDLAGGLKSLGDPDVIVVQEVWRPDGVRGVVDDFAESAGYKQEGLVLSRATIRRRWPQADPDGEGTYGLSVLSRLPSSVVARPAVGPTPGDPVPERRVLHVELEVGDRLVDLVAIHLTSRLPHGPPLQLLRLRQLLPAAGRPGIVAGDCNFWGPPTSAILRGWRRAVRGRTWPAPRPHSQIDHILVRGDIDVADGRVLAPVGSDHLPIRAQLRLG